MPTQFAALSITALRSFYTVGFVLILTVHIDCLLNAQRLQTGNSSKNPLVHDNALDKWPVDHIA